MEETESHPDSMLVAMASLDGSTPVETLLVAIHLERSEARTHATNVNFNYKFGFQHINITTEKKLLFYHILCHQSDLVLCHKSHTRFVPVKATLTQCQPGKFCDWYLKVLHKTKWRRESESERKVKQILLPLKNFNKCTFQSLFIITRLTKVIMNIVKFTPDQRRSITVAKQLPASLNPNCVLALASEPLNLRPIKVDPPTFTVSNGAFTGNFLYDTGYHSLTERQESGTRRV